MNVLLIEDEENMQKIIAAYLRRYAEKAGEDIHIKALFDPVQGLFEATTNGSFYDLILLDVRLPKLTGDEIYRSVSHVNPAMLNRIIFVTGYSEDLYVRFPNSDLRVLEKPFHYEDFEKALASALPER